MLFRWKSVATFLFGSLTTLVVDQMYYSKQMASFFYHQTDAGRIAKTTATQQHHFLEKLMYKYGSDKSHDDHGYTDLYQMILDPIRLDITNVSEIGISAGQSVQAWYHYFPRANIYAFDVATTSSIKRIVKQLGDRVQYTEIDLLKSDLQEIGLYNETMDIIVEDASHQPWQQQAFLSKLFCLVKPGGYYVVEDINYGHEPALKFHQFPEKLNPEVQYIMQNHDTIFVDTHVGHRDWPEWLKLTAPLGVAKNHLEHNSYLLVIRKRHEALPSVQINLGVSAMQPNKVLLDRNISNPLGER